METHIFQPFADKKSGCPRVQRQAKAATIATLSSNDGCLFEVMKEWAFSSFGSRKTGNFSIDKEPSL